MPASMLSIPPSSAPVFSLRFDHPETRLGGLSVTPIASISKPAIRDWSTISLDQAGVDGHSNIEGVGLSQLAMVDDRIAIAVPRGLPSIRAALETIVDPLLRLDVARVEIVFEAGVSEDDVAWANTHWGDRVFAESHVGKERGQVAFVAADENADPMYLSKALVDADCVLPIEWTRDPEVSAGAAWIYPKLADTDAQRRWGGFKNDRSTDVSGAQASADVGTVSTLPDIPWHLGVLFWFQAVVNDDGELCELRGRFRHSKQPGPNQSSTDNGIVSAAEKPTFELVIASMDGDPAIQNLADVLAAIDNALPYLEAEGTLVICTQCVDVPSRPSGGTLPELDEDVDRSPAEARTEEHPFLPYDPILAVTRAWAKRLEDHRILVCGGPDVAAWADDWDVTCLEDDQAIARLAAGLSSIGLMRAAHLFQAAELPLYPVK
ncbi:MAG: hypothetical protein AAF958_02905 [Planctomycetota bacterium]